MEVVRAVYVFAAGIPKCSVTCRASAAAKAAGISTTTTASSDARRRRDDRPSGNRTALVEAICLDVARDAMQMHSSGAGIASIAPPSRRKYRASFPTMTPTPLRFPRRQMTHRDRARGVRAVCSRPSTRASTSAPFDGPDTGDSFGQSLSEADVRLRRRHAAGGSPSVRARPVRRSAGARRVRRAAASATARSPTTCCGCAAPIAIAIWVEVTAHAEIDGRTAALRVEALMRDVSERKRLEDQARDLYHQLLQAEKLAALGQTISGVAHELNNPLATILTWAERLSQRIGRRSDQARSRNDPERVGARREDRPQPADLRAQAPHDARDGRRESGGARDAGAALVRAAPQQHHHPRGARRRPAAGVRRSAPDPAGAAQPDHQRGAGDARRARPRHADPPHLARPRRATPSSSKSTTMGRACRRTCSRGSSIRSSRPRKSAKAPASA